MLVFSSCASLHDGVDLTIDQDGTRFEVHANGTINDTITRLTWMQRDNGHDVNQYQSDTFCRNLDIAQFENWRLPDDIELQTLLSADRNVKCGALTCRMKKALVIRAVMMAINLRKPPPGLIHHSNRGSQYASQDYQKLLKPYGMSAA